MARSRGLSGRRAADVQGIIYPSTTGALCAVLRTGLTASALPYSSGVTTQPKLPATLTARMVTVRDDSGPDDGVQSRRRYGFNVWAATSPDAENLALLCMAILRGGADGNPITALDTFSGPYEIPTGTPYNVGGKNLTNYFFTCRVTARGSNF